MRVSFDLDGTALDEHAEFFRELAWGLKSRGHEVGVLTGHRQEAEESDCDKLEAMGFPRPDFFVGRQPDEMSLNGTVTKTRAIKELGIAVHFDDYDFGHPDTCRLFPESGVENRVFRIHCNEWPQRPEDHPFYRPPRGER